MKPEILAEVQSQVQEIHNSVIAAAALGNDHYLVAKQVHHRHWVFKALGLPVEDDIVTWKGNLMLTNLSSAGRTILLGLVEGKRRFSFENQKQRDIIQRTYSALGWKVTLEGNQLCIERP